VEDLYCLMVNELMKNHGAQKNVWHYETGLIMLTLSKVFLQHRDKNILDFIAQSMRELVNADGDISGYRQDEYNLDQINTGKIFFFLHEHNPDPRWYIAARRLREQLKNHPRTKNQGFWHKKIYPDQMWLDGLYMQAPFLAEYAVHMQTDSDIDEVVFQLVHMNALARDPASGLLYHACDESLKQLWADPKTGCSPHFWGRAMGWYVMALVDVMEILGKHKKVIQVLKPILAGALAALRAVRDVESGLWFQVLDQGNRAGNYLETSASAMFCYAMAKAVRLGLIDPEYRDIARQAYAQLVAREFSKDETGACHLGGICSVAGLGGVPYRDGSFAYYVSEKIVADDYKGTGPFILAGLEIGLAI